MAFSYQKISVQRQGENLQYLVKFFDEDTNQEETQAFNFPPEDPEIEKRIVEAGVVLQKAFEKEVELKGSIDPEEVVPLSDAVEEIEVDL